MTKSDLMHRILIYEGLGIGIILVFVWLDEVLDFPHVMFGAPATPVNVTESVFESVIIGLMGFVVLKISRDLLKRVRYLEGFLATCAFCKKIRVAKDWIPFEEYIQSHSAAEFAHILCPECIRKHYGPTHAEPMHDSGKGQGSGGNQKNDPHQNLQDKPSPEP